MLIDIALLQISTHMVWYICHLSNSMSLNETTRGVQKVFQVKMLDWKLFKIYTPIKRTFLQNSRELKVDMTSLS